MFKNINFLFYIINFEIFECLNQVTNNNNYYNQEFQKIGRTLTIGQKLVLQFCTSIIKTYNIYLHKYHIKNYKN